MLTSNVQLGNILIMGGGQAVQVSYHRTGLEVMPGKQVTYVVIIIAYIRFFVKNVLCEFHMFGKIIVLSTQVHYYVSRIN